jgi:hypothetical protein
MSVLQANLDRGAVLVPGEHLVIKSAVQRAVDAEGGTYSSHGQRACHCALSIASVHGSHTRRTVQSHTGHVSIRLVLGWLRVGHDCSCQRLAHVI